MQMIKLLSKILAVIIVLMILPLQTDANEGKIQDQIKVGIRFGESATPVVSLASPNGLALGYYEGDNFKGIMQFFEDIIVRKDDYFINVNGSFITYDFDSQSGSGNKNIEGPVHIQIGNEFSNQQEAENFLNELPNMMEHPYLAYENGWHVWVGCYTSVSEAEETSKNIKLLIQNADLRIITKDDKRVQVLNKYGKVSFMYNTDDVVYAFKAIPQESSNGIIQLDGKSFRGSIIIHRYIGSDLTVINRLDIEEYLYGVVPREMSGDWPIEAQKAQAVAARSYAVVNLNRHENYGFDVCASSHCQVYGGYNSEKSRSTMAVDETRGALLTYDGKVVTAFYHSNSGGHTEDSENVWSNPVGYLRGVDDPYSIGAPNDTWVKVYTKQEIEGVLASNGLSVGTLQNIVVEERSKNSRVLKLAFYGTSGSEILEKGKIRSMFGNNSIKSTWFDMGTNGERNANIMVLYDLNQPAEAIDMNSKYILTAQGLKEFEVANKYVSNGKEYKLIASNANANVDQYTFTGKGWGHGLGMSQWGAKKMAEDGFNYEQILTHYYTGTNIK
ncbi:SpoIID/LytB domain-containing protein [Marinisporobacter balticus]|uniref:Stage II sporulation protein D n=1 Tax=Marinisporobacter balticus TaxID=2018667 RepID=A0A4R2L0T0_9FIRM|nr:SpoIID/LytB domain-containing protein [Marinisporobacter balticus]TCO79853.1 stage II sporulation protein D [Marinisporobacter balticus]